MATPSIEKRAREFCETAFGPFGVPSLEPYIKIISDLIEGAVKEERESCAHMALAIDSKRGNEKEIARAIRARGDPALSAAERNGD